MTTMQTMWDTYIRNQRDSDGPKPTALGTRFRVSDAGSCLRQRAMTAAGIPECEEIDTGTLLAFNLGNEIHNQLQAALVAHWGEGATLEEKVDLRPHGADLSGHADGVIRRPTEDGNDVYVDCVHEYKSLGGYAAKTAKQTGMPKLGHIAQAALNAIATGTDQIHLVYVAKEKEWREGIAPGDMWEWTFHLDDPLDLGDNRSVTARELAAREIRFVQTAAGSLDKGYLPPRWIPNNELEIEEEQNPGPYMVARKGSSWQCRYCRHNTSCAAIGGGAVELSEARVTLGLPEPEESEDE